MVEKIREEILMGKSGLAKKPGISPLTIDRIEKGGNCRIETKRKIILALGYDLSEKDADIPPYNAGEIRKPGVTVTRTEPLKARDCQRAARQR